MRYDPHSRDAWEGFRKSDGELTINAKILRALSLCPGLSCPELVVVIRSKPQTVSAQIRHLRDDGCLQVVGEGKWEGRKVNRYGLNRHDWDQLELAGQALGPPPR